MNREYIDLGLQETDQNQEQPNSNSKGMQKLGSVIKREEGQTGLDYVVSQLQQVFEAKMQQIQAKLMGKLQNIETRIYKIGLNFGSRLNDMEKKIHTVRKSSKEIIKIPSRRIQRGDQEEEEEKIRPKQKNERVGDYYWTLDEEQKLQAVAAVRSGLKSKMQVALQYGKSLRTIKRWMTKYEH